MRWKARGVPAVCLGVFLVGTLPVWMHAQETGGSRRSALERQSAALMLRNVHDALKKNYYDPAFRGVDMDARYAAYLARLNRASTRGEALALISAYLSALRDPHTYFAPPNSAQRTDYGFQLEFFGERCFITTVRPNSDAARRLHPGDEILAMNGVAARRQNLPAFQRDAVSFDTGGAIRLQLRDLQGFTREVMLKDDGEEQISGAVYRDMSFSDSSRSNVAMPEQPPNELVRERWVENGSIFIWKMPWFGLDEAQTDSMMHRVQKHQALILDLRGNRGGVVESLAYLAGWFFRRDVLIATPAGRKSMKVILARGRKNAFTGDLFVLVDSRSASGAELFARVMQIEHRGIVVGDRTVGAVMESRVYTFRAGTDPSSEYGAAISHAELRMSDGKSLEGAGVTPDVLAYPSAGDIAAGRDPVLARAAQLAGLNLSAEEAGKFSPFEWAPVP